MKKPLYVNRKLLNAQAVIDWAVSQGFTEVLPAKELHVTVAYSKAPVDWDTVKIKPNKILNRSEDRVVAPLGEEGAVVLKFQSRQLFKRWQEILDAGASWDHESYTPHITLTYKKQSIDLSAVEPYNGPLELGPEVYEEIQTDWHKQFKE